MTSLMGDNGRIFVWREYIDAPGLSRLELGYRILQAYDAGFTRADVAEWLGCHVGTVTKYANCAKLSQSK